jgi:hypothetical protein
LNISLSFSIAAFNLALIKDLESISSLGERKATLMSKHPKYYQRIIIAGKKYEKPFKEHAVF